MNNSLSNLVAMMALVAATAACGGGDDAPAPPPAAPAPAPAPASTATRSQLSDAQALDHTAYRKGRRGTGRGWYPRGRRRRVLDLLVLSPMRSSRP